MNHHMEFIKYLLDKGGPDGDDYYDLDACISEISHQAKNGSISPKEIDQLREAFGESFSIETMQGFVFHKPHGYAGDFEIIDRIYELYVSGISHLSKWDEYMQNHAATEAVRNRARYFEKIVKKHAGEKQVSNVLNLASGPGRDMLRFYNNNPDTGVKFECVDQDKNAIKYAKNLCKDHLSNIQFHVKNAVRFQSEKEYNLIWSAGLFDYFEDDVFILMLKKLRSMVSIGGEIVIGNFSTLNPSRPYMELFEWHLHHRSPHTLVALAKAAGFKKYQIQVNKEALGVNLFLHIYPGCIAEA